MYYRTRDGVRLKGSTAVEVLTDLRSRAWLPGSDLEAYIRKTARAAALQTGRPFRADTAANLLADLMGAGLVLRED